MAEYQFTLRRAVWGISLTAAMVLTEGRAARMGIDRPGFADNAAGEARERAKAYFSEHYQII